MGETTDYVKAFTKAYEEGKITKAPTVVENLTAQTRGELCYFEHSIVGILEQNYDREWFGVAFKKTGEGGTAEYAYAGFSDNIRSVQEVSSRALNKLVYHAEDLEKNSPEEFALLTSNKPILEEFVTTGIRNVLGGSALAYEISGPSAMYVNDCATLVLSVSSKVHIVSEWTSSAPEVVAVDPDTGELTALAAGTATIMAESSGLYSEAFEISVTAADESEKTIVKTAEWSENYRAEIDNTTVKEGVSSLKYTFINGMPVNPGSGIITSLRGRFLYLEEVTAVSGNDAFGLFGTETDWRNLYVGFYVKTNQALNLAVRWQNRSGGVWKGSAEMTFGGYVANKDIGPNADWQYVEFPLNGLFEDSLINNHYVRIFNQYSVYTSMLRVSNGMTDEKLTDKGKYYLSTKKDYSARFATDAIKEFYDKKVQRSKYGLNDFEQYKDLHPSCEEMKKVKSHFYDQIFEVFEDNSIEAAKRKKYREEVGTKYVWQPRKKPE